MTKKKAERGSLEFYLEQKYPVTLYPDRDGGYVAEIKDLPGCMTQGETAEEALAEVEDARMLWIETAYEHGDDVALPSTETQYSGKTLLRMPRSLHQKLAEGAEREGISLNQCIVSLLSEANAMKTIEPLKEKVEAIYRSLHPSDASFADRCVAYIPESSIKGMYRQAIEAILKETRTSQNSSLSLVNWLTSISTHDTFMVKRLEKILDHKDELTQILKDEKELKSKVQDLIEKAELDKEEVTQ